MPTFRYQGYAADGKSRKGRMEALDPKSVREQLRQQDIFVKQLHQVSAGRKRGSSVRMRSILYRELAALLKAGLPLDRCLMLLGDNPELGQDGDALAAVRDAVREGAGLSDAMATHLQGLREHERAVLESGEQTGAMAAVCNELADVLEEEADISERIRATLAYPLVVVGLALVAMGIVIWVLLPTYGRLLRSLNQELPALTKAMLFLGDASRHPVGVGVLLLLVAAAIFLVRRIQKGTWNGWDRIRFRLPVIGPCLSTLVRVRFARTFALLFEGGVSVHRAFRIAGAATGSAMIEEACDTRASTIEQGGRIADAVRGVPYLNVDLPGWLEAAEAGGDIPGMLRHAARGHQRSWERKVNRALSLLEPLLIVAVGILILLVALSVLQPMLKINQSLGVGS